MNNLIVSDTNIFIDLINGDLLDEFFNLPYNISLIRPFENGKSYYLMNGVGFEKDIKKAQRYHTENILQLNRSIGQEENLDEAFVTNLAQKPAHQGTLNKILYSSDSVNYPLYLPNQYPKFVKIYRPDGGFIKCN